VDDAESEGDSMSYEKDALHTKVTFSEDAKLGSVSGFVAEIREIPEVYAFFNTGTRELDIYVNMHSDYYHGRSPHASHEFCHGWITRGIVEKLEWQLRNMGGYYVTWEQVQWIPERRQIVKVDDTPVTFEVKKVPLHA